jgi:phosphate transport system permease protein
MSDVSSQPVLGPQPRPAIQAWEKRSAGQKLRMLSIGDGALSLGSILLSGFVLALLASLIWSVLSLGIKAMSWQFISQNNIYITPTTSLEYGGVGHAILGTVIIVGLSTLITVPLGVLVAVYLTETREKPRSAVRTLVQLSLIHI